MTIIRLQIDGQTFYLDEGHDVELLKQQVVDAAKTGAAFVDFDAAGRGRVSVLVTPQLGVRFEVSDAPVDDAGEWAPSPSGAGAHHEDL